jgi:hypothetical protein
MLAMLSLWPLGCANPALAALCFQVASSTPDQVQVMVGSEEKSTGLRNSSLLPFAVADVDLGGGRFEDLQGEVAQIEVTK